jgi:hypothetical protein
MGSGIPLYLNLSLIKTIRIPVLLPVFLSSRFKNLCVSAPLRETFLTP